MAGLSFEEFAKGAPATEAPASSGRMPTWDEINRQTRAEQPERDAFSRRLTTNEQEVEAGRPSSFPATSTVIEGSEPPAAGAPASKTSMSFAEFSGKPAEPGKPGSDPFAETRLQAATGVVLDRLKAAGGEAAALADMVLSLPGFGLKVGTQMGATTISGLQHMTSGGERGVSFKPNAAGYSAYTVGREAAQDVMERPWLRATMNPLQKIMQMFGTGEIYEASGTVKAMNKFGELLDEAGVWAEQASGGRVARDSVPMLVETLMYGIPGAFGKSRPAIDPAMQKVLREHAGKLKREAEVEGIMRADEAAANATTPVENLARSPVRQQIDELLNSRPVAPAGPEQVISMAAGKPRIKLKLAEEGLPLTAELEAALDKPRFERTAEETSALQRWHDSWLRLPEQTRTAIMASGAVGLGMLVAPEGEEGLGALGGLAMAGAMKQPGGMWHPEAISRMAQPLESGLIRGLVDAIQRADAPPETVGFWSTQVQTGRDWATSRIKTYLNRYAGTSRDPLKDIEIPFGEGTKRWEEVTDAIFRSQRADDVTVDVPGSPGAFQFLSQRGVPPAEPIWDIASPNSEAAMRANFIPARQAFTSYLSHVGDYLRQNVPPEKLGQYDFVRAVRETAANDARVAREMQKAQQASTASLPVYKEYPDGFKWVELKLPEKLTPEQAKGVREQPWAEVFGRKIPPEQQAQIAAERQRPGSKIPAYGYEAIGPDGKPIKNSYTGDIAKGKTPEEAYLAGQLAQEGNVMGHCVGGYCEGVAAGESRIFSLRDAKGKSHVTVEVAPRKALRLYQDGAIDPETGQAMTAEMRKLGYTWKYDGPMSGVGWWKDGKHLADSEVHPVMQEVLQKLGVEDTPDILQIKGKQNRAPAAQYQPYVQDFVRNAPEGGPAKWGEVGDLENTGLRDVRRLEPSDFPRRETNRYTTLDENAANFVRNRFQGKDFVTIEEWQKALAEYDTAANPGWRGTEPPTEFGRGQRGQIDSKLLIGAGTIGLGGLVGSLWADDPIRGFVLGSLAGTALALPGTKGLRGAADVIRDYAGQVSTELLNASPPLHRRLITHAQQELENTHKTLGRLVPWLKESVNLPASERTALYDAIFMKDTAALARINAGNEKLVAGWREVRNVLNELGQQSRILGRFKDMMEDYFPQRVKDYKGLKKALEQPVLDRLEAKLKAAGDEALRKRGFGLTEVERDAIINREIRDHYRPATFRPGYAKPRRIQEVTESIRPFYHTPQESLAITVAEIVKDIELTKLFGKELVQKQQNGRTYIDLDASIGNIIGAEQAKGKLTGEQLDRMEDILRKRFGPGETSPAKWIQNLQNTGYAALLADLPSAVVQMADPAISIPAHGVRATLVATARRLTGNAKITAKDMSLMDHIAEDLAFGSTQLGRGKNITRAAVAGGAAVGAVAGGILADDIKGAIPGAAAGAFIGYSKLVGTSAALNKVLRQGVFSPIDRFGKDIQLGAAHEKLSRWAEKDMPRLKEFYGEWFGADFPQFAADLRAGNMTPAVRSALFHELSRTQPISKLEAPIAYLNNPNARIAWQLKRFMLKQGDFIYREAHDAIKKGHVARGLGNLTEYALVLGLSGATTSMIKDWLNGRPVNFEASDVAENVLKTFGLSNYVMDKMRDGKAGPVEAIGGSLLPPWMIVDRIIGADPRAVQYIPVIGELYYNWELGGQEKAEIRLQKKAKKEGRDLELSPKAELYIERQREKRREKREREQEARP